MPDPHFQPSRPLPYGRQFISEADVAAVVASLHGDYLTQGPTVGEFDWKRMQLLNRNSYPPTFTPFMECPARW